MCTRCDVLATASSVVLLSSSVPPKTPQRESFCPPTGAVTHELRPPSDQQVAWSQCSATVMTCSAAQSVLMMRCCARGVVQSKYVRSVGTRSEQRSGHPTRKASLSDQPPRREWNSSAAPVLCKSVLRAARAIKNSPNKTEKHECVLSR